MDGATRFLRALGHALDLRLRRGDALVRLTAEGALVDRSRELLNENPLPVFHFDPPGVRYGILPLTGFEQWHWSALLASRGIVRLELVAPPTPGSLAFFLDVATGLVPSDAPLPHNGIRWSAGPSEPPTRHEEYPLNEALGVMRQLFRSASRGEPLRRGDIAAVVAALDCVLAGEHGRELPLLHVESREGYQHAHALNTALLAMRLSDALRMGAEERRDCGLAALLHDIGMARLPTVEEQFTPQDRARIRGHPLEGARLLLREGEALEGAAVASYEHHLRQDGSGYPQLNYPREPHLLSRIVAVVDAFDALLAPRLDRPGSDPQAALSEIERAAGSQFDTRIVEAFSQTVAEAVERRQLALTLRPI